MPGYGVEGPAEGRGLLDWSWATERLAASHDYWLATVTPDARPHVMPVWGVWAGGALWFSSSPSSRKARNLAANRRAVATTDDALRPVVVEGDVDRVATDGDVSSFTVRVNAKYSTDYTVEFFSANALFRLRPSWAFALDEDDFTGSPTRWVFRDAPTAT